MDKPNRFQVDSFTLKIIAILGMTADHIGNAYWDQLPLLGRCLLFTPGGLTFPIMAYLLTVGYRHTSDVRRYALRLGVFALIALVPFWWVLGQHLNVLFTLLMGLVVIWADDHLKNRVLFGVLFIAAILASNWCDWQFIGVPMVFLYHRVQNRYLKVLLPALVVWAMGAYYVLQLTAMQASFIAWLNFLPNLLYIFIGVTATIPLLLAYNGQRGRPLKYFFYAYYPLHIACLGLLRGILFGVWL